MYNLSVSEIRVSEARATLPQILDRVTDGEEVTITRHGRPVAVLVRPDLLRVRRVSAAFEMAADVDRLLRDARDLPVDAGGALSVEYAEAHVRSGRQRS
jgi:antitoxin (DNA-binding transcriptional repressor) of toxin-antitoxin stability system